MCIYFGSHYGLLPMALQMVGQCFPVPHHIGCGSLIFSSPVAGTFMMELSSRASCRGCWRLVSSSNICSFIFSCLQGGFVPVGFGRTYFAGYVRRNGKEVRLRSGERRNAALIKQILIVLPGREYSRMNLLHRFGAITRCGLT